MPMHVLKAVDSSSVCNLWRVECNGRNNTEGSQESTCKEWYAGFKDQSKITESEVITVLNGLSKSLTFAYCCLNEKYILFFNFLLLVSIIRLGCLSRSQSPIYGNSRGSLQRRDQPSRSASGIGLTAIAYSRPWLPSAVTFHSKIYVGSRWWTGRDIDKISESSFTHLRLPYMTRIVHISISQVTSLKNLGQGSNKRADNALKS